MDTVRCCLCGKPIKGYGNNPWPLVDDEDARCCDDCNFEKVLPARIAASKRKEARVVKEPLDLGKVKLSFICPQCGKKSTLLVSEEGLQRYEAGESIQRAFPDLNASERELLITGLCIDCQDEIFR